MSATNLRTLLTAQQVAALLALDDKTIYRLSKHGTLPSVRIGRAVRYLERDVETFVAQHRKGGKTDGMADSQ